tara:strand:- start:1574 stop:2275 length:702 start_codon:yes stop_codon:yes gene_type:complete
MKVLIKAMRPHRQKVLTEDGQEMRLQQWANKTASAALRGAGGEAGGEQFTQARDALMREAVANPNEHGLKFMGERMPFEGQTLEESLSEPDVEGEQAAVDQEFAPEKPETPDIFDEEGKLRQTLPQGEVPPPASNEQKDVEEYRERVMDKLRQERGDFDPDAEAEHLRRIMTSRDVAIRDAWSVLKQDLSFMTEEERRQYELGQKLDALRRHGGLPQKSPVPSRGFPSAAGNA